MAQYSGDTGTEFIEKVVTVNRNSKVVKGGRRFSFSSLVVVGDGNGNAGLGFGKANEVTDAIGKALTDGRRNMTPIPRYRTTIPFAVVGRFKGGKVLLKPATSGTGVIAGGPVRAIMEAVGIRDVLSKSLGSNNPVNVAKATMVALGSLMDKRQAFERRGITLRERSVDVETTAAPTEDEEMAAAAIVEGPVAQENAPATAGDQEVVSAAVAPEAPAVEDEAPATPAPEAPAVEDEAPAPPAQEAPLAQAETPATPPSDKTPAAEEDDEPAVEGARKAPADDQASM